MIKLYGKLASTNIKNSKQLYIPYLLTGIITVAMFYTMVAITNNRGMDQMPGSATLGSMMFLGTIVIGIFSFIFLFYTNSFIMKRRKKELGVYNILGMEKKHLAGVLFVETLFTALVSIGGGLLTGIIFNKLLMMLLYKLVGFTSPIQFSVCTSGIRNAVILFGWIYAMTYIYDLMQVKLANPIELLHGGNVGEREPKTKILLTIIGFVCIGVGYYIAITTESPVDALLLFFVAVVLVIVGTYALFTAGSIAVLKMLRKNKKFYYKTSHFTSVSGMIYRMKQNAVGLANICILSTMVLVMVSTTVCMFIGVDDELVTRYPTDIMISSQYTDIPDEDGAFLAEVNRVLKEENRIVADESVRTTFTVMATMENGEIEFIKESNHYYNETAVMFVVLTADSFKQMSGEAVPDLEDNEIMLYGMPVKENDEITFIDHTYQVKENRKFINSSDKYMTGFLKGVYYLVVKDDVEFREIYEDQKNYYGDNASRYTYDISFNLDGSKEQKMACAASLRQMINEYAPAQPAYSRYVEARDETSQEFFSLYGGLFFLGLFLGTMFVMVTVLIIFYKQISEGYDDKDRFAIMEKVGMSSAEVKSTISAQIRTVFLLPILAASVHVIAAFPMIRRILLLLNLTNTTLFACCLVGTIVVFTLIYLLVFVLTSRSYYKIVGNQVG